jgi:hypothetical protein
MHEIYLYPFIRSIEVTSNSNCVCNH